MAGEGLKTLPLFTSNALTVLSAGPYRRRAGVSGHAVNRPFMPANPTATGVESGWHGPPRGDQGLVIRQDRHADDRLAMIREPLQLASGRRVPETDRLVVRAGRDTTGILERKTQGTGPVWPPRMVLPSATPRAVLSSP